MRAVLRAVSRCRQADQARGLLNVRASRARLARVAHCGRSSACLLGARWRSAQPAAERQQVAATAAVATPPARTALHWLRSRRQLRTGSSGARLRLTRVAERRARAAARCAAHRRQRPRHHRARQADPRRDRHGRGHRHYRDDRSHRLLPHRRRRGRLDARRRQAGLRDRPREHHGRGCRRHRAAQRGAGERDHHRSPTTTPTAQGSAQLERTEMERVAGTGNDLVRTLSAMPGVVNFQLPLGYAGIVIRGASPQDSKILVDDFRDPDAVSRHRLPLGDPDRVDRQARLSARRVRRVVRPRVVGRRRADLARRIRAAQRPGRGLGDRRRPDRAGIDRQGHDVHDRVSAIGDRSAAAAHHPVERRSVADHGAALLRRAAPHRSQDQRALEYPTCRASAPTTHSRSSPTKRRTPTSGSTTASRFARPDRDSRTVNDGSWTAKLAVSGMGEQFVFERGSIDRSSSRSIRCRDHAARARCCARFPTSSSD